MVLNDIFGNLEPGVAIESGAELLLIRNLIHEGKYGGVVCYSSGLGNISDNDIWGEEEERPFLCCLLFISCANMGAAALHKHAHIGQECCDHMCAITTWFAL